MQVTISAVGPDACGLADPIVHYVTEVGANIAEIQMFNHDEDSIFSMVVRIDLPVDKYAPLQKAMKEIGETTCLSIRTWSPELIHGKPKLAICVTHRPETPAALLKAIAQGHVPAEATLMISNRPTCRHLAEEHKVPWYNIGDETGKADNEKLIALCDEHQVDFIILARYMRVLPAESCWKYAGGRIINLHHGLLPSFPGIRPYHEAHASRMLTYGATCHFIVPELDAGNQIVYQSTFTVPPGTSRDDIIQQGQSENEPHCLVEGVRRVAAGEVQLHFNRVVAIEK